jgi:hypothetical protein
MLKKQKYCTAGGRSIADAANYKAVSSGPLLVYFPEDGSAKKRTLTDAGYLTNIAECISRLNCAEQCSLRSTTWPTPWQTTHHSYKHQQSISKEQEEQIRLWQMEKLLGPTCLEVLGSQQLRISLRDKETAAMARAAAAVGEKARWTEENTSGVSRYIGRDRRGQSGGKEE